MIYCSHVTCNIKNPETMKALCRGITCPHFESSSLSFNFPYFKPWNKILFLGGQKKIGVRARIGFSIDAKMWSSTTLDASSQQQISIQTDRKPNRSSSLYSRPSLLEMQKEKQTNRAMVYEFLKGIGIVPDELEGLELPVSIDVMRDRVDFLHKLGLTIQDINNYPLVLGCSVKKNMIPVLDYLGKLGVRKSNFTEFLRRYPQVLHSSVVIDLAPVVKYLQGLDIKPNDIPGVLERYPEVLGFKLEGTMSTSVAYLVGIGVARREIGGILTRYPEILGMRVARVIKPFVEYLEAIGIPRQGVARLIEKRPHILGFSFDDGVKRNVDVLLESGVRKEALSSIVMQYPEILGLELEPRIVSQQHFFNFNLDISPEEFGKVVEKMPQVVSLSQTPVIKHVEFLKNCGFSTENVKRMVLACPLVLALNLDIMRLSFDYFQTEMGRGLEELVEYPAFFTYSLESTIKPRHRRIAEKGLKCSLAWLLNCSDQKFEERLDYDYIDIEEMKTEPSFSMASRLEQSADESTSEDADYSEDEDF